MLRSTFNKRTCQSAAEGSSYTQTVFFRALTSLCACQRVDRIQSASVSRHRTLSSSTINHEPYHTRARSYGQREHRRAHSTRRDTSGKATPDSNGQWKALRQYIGKPKPGNKKREQSQSKNRDERSKTRIWPEVWPKRIQEFVGTLPIRNYANDFVVWDMSAEDVWDKYQLLPRPGCTAVSRTALQFILSALATERPRTKRGAERYLSVIEEMKAQVPPIRPLTSEWTALISFTGRLHKVPSSSDLDACLQIWDEMENTYLTSADRATFNVLIDVATKCRRWETVDSLLVEMHRRMITLDRFTWTTLIYGAGLRHEGDEVRRLSSMIIEKGEILDIVVINAITSALIRAGHGEEAEDIFSRILASAKLRARNSREGLGSYLSRNQVSRLTSQYQRRAKANRTLLKEGKSLSREDVSPISDSAILFQVVPNEATFNMILAHHCRTTGDHTRVDALLEDMERFEIPKSGAMYESLLRGFGMHGRDIDAWNLEGLNHVFQSLLATRGITYTQNLTRAALRAYEVLGNKQHVQRCWHALDQAWQRAGGDPQRRSSNVLRQFDASLAGNVTASGSSFPTSE